MRVGTVGTLALIMGCGSSRTPGPAHAPAAVLAVDADGDTVRLVRPATRVVSLVPSATDMLVGLGAVSVLAGRTRYDRDPAVAAVPSVGGGVDPDLERLTALHPDLVIVWEGYRTSHIAQALAAENVPVYAAPARDTAAFFQSAAALGTLTGRDSAARALVTSVRATLAAVHASVAGRPVPRVLYVIWGDPPMTVGPHTFIAELIGVAGGRNVFDDAATDWPRISMEQIVRRAPDVVILSVGEDSARGAERLRTSPGWRTLPAVRANRVAEVPADLANRPGPQIAEIARRFRDAEHPDAQ